LAPGDVASKAARQENAPCPTPSRTSPGGRVEPPSWQSATMSEIRPRP
jgi:hypothetical protein